jgi:hypothetical protein
MSNRDRSAAFYIDNQILENPVITIGKIDRLKHHNKRRSSYVIKSNVDSDQSEYNKNDLDEFSDSSDVTIKIGSNRKKSFRPIQSKSKGSGTNRSSKFTNSLNSNPDDNIVEQTLNGLSTSSENEYSVSFNNTSDNSSDERFQFDKFDEINGSDSSNDFRVGKMRNHKIIKFSKNREKIEKNIALNDLISKFNTVMMGMISHLIEYYGDQETISLKDIFIDIMNKDPDEPISYFLLNIYKNDEYRHNILEQSDKLFNDQSHNDINKMFEFGKVWKQIDYDTKKFIKKSMMVLVKICEKYILKITS